MVTRHKAKHYEHEVNNAARLVFRHGVVGELIHRVDAQQFAKILIEVGAEGTVEIVHMMKLCGMRRRGIGITFATCFERYVTQEVIR